MLACCLFSYFRVNVCHICGWVCIWAYIPGLQEATEGAQILGVCVLLLGCIASRAASRLLARLPARCGFSHRAGHEPYSYLALPSSCLHLTTNFFISPPSHPYDRCSGRVAAPRRSTTSRCVLNTHLPREKDAQMRKKMRRPFPERRLKKKKKCQL